MKAIARRSSGERRGSAVAAAVEAALREDRLLLAFQPVVCAATGRVDYFECLLRMRDEGGELVSGGEFITLVEELGWIGLIDRYVLEKTVHELAADPEVRLGFNISGITAGDHRWLRSLTALLCAEGVGFLQGHHFGRPTIGRASLQMAEHAVS